MQEGKERNDPMKRFLMSAAAAMMALFTVFFSVSAGIAETGTPVYQAGDLFTARDLEQDPELEGAVRYTVQDGQDIRITAAGTYILGGSASEVTVRVEAGKDDKVQLVLDSLSVSNTRLPVIYAKTADKVFITVSGDSSLSVTGNFIQDGTDNTDGVIYAKTDLTLNGTARLDITSTKNGIVGKDDLKITGGTYVISAASKAIEANDSIRIAGGSLDLTAGTDGLHAENNSDDTSGNIYIGGGTLAIRAGDDAIHATAVVQIDGGTITAAGAEGIEGTYIQLNGGTVSIQASDDGVNAARKSSAYTPTVEINGGEITVAMGAGDTDGIDANGNIIMNGGTVNVTGSSPFDYDGNAEYNGGTIIANGQQVNAITGQMAGGRGGFGGGFGGRGGGFGGSRGGRGGW